MMRGIFSKKPAPEPPRSSLIPLNTKIHYHDNSETVKHKKPVTVERESRFIFVIFLTGNRPYVNYVYDHPPVRSDGQNFYLLDAEMYKKRRKDYERVCMEAIHSGMFNQVHVYTDPQPFDVQQTRCEKQLYYTQLCNKILIECNTLGIRCDVTTTPQRTNVNSPRMSSLESYRAAYISRLEKQDVEGVRRSKKEVIQSFSTVCQKMGMVFLAQLLHVKEPENEKALLALLQCWKEMYENVTSEIDLNDPDLDKVYSFSKKQF